MNKTITVPFEQNSTNQPVTQPTLDIAVRAATGTIYGMERKTDQKLWAYETSTPKPVFTKNRTEVYVVNEHGRIDVLDRRTGKILTRGLGTDSELDGDIVQLLYDAGTLVVASRDGVAAYGYDLQKRWRSKGKIPVFELTTAGDDIVVALDDYKGVLALNRSSGEMDGFCSEGVCHITADNSGIYGNQFESIKKIDYDGRKVWENKVAEGPVGVITAANGRVYLGTIGGQFTALDADNGMVIWKVDEFGKFPWQIEETAQGLEVTVTEPYYSKESRVLRLNPKTGKRI